MKKPLRFWAVATARPLGNGQCLERRSQRLLRRQNDSCFGRLFRWRRLRTYARAVARHIGKHIPGNPSLVVDNMDGAGSLIAANYTYNKADRDGTFIGVGTALSSSIKPLATKRCAWMPASSTGSARQ